MSVYKRANSGNYYVEVTIPGTKRKIIRSAKTTNKALARRFEHHLRESLYRQHYLGEISAISIKDAIGLYKAQKASSVSARNLECQVRAMQAQLARVIPLSADVHTLTSANLIHLVHLRKTDGASDGTIQQLLLSIRGMVNSVSDRFLTPSKLVFPKIKISNARTRTLSEAEENRLLSYLEGHENKDHYALVVMLLDSGARLNEVQQLKWDQVKLNEKRIVLWRSKTRTQSVIHMTDRVYAVLKERALSGVEGLVFPNKDGGKRVCTPKAIQNAYKKAGIVGFKTHDLRHTAASKLIRKGMSLYEVSQVLGHSAIATTQRYAHLDAEQVASKAAKLLDA